MKKQVIVLAVILLIVVVITVYLFYMYGIAEAKEVAPIVHPPA